MTQAQLWESIRRHEGPLGEPLPALPVWARAEGATVWDADGHSYLDLSSQLRLFVPEDMDLGMRPERIIRELTETEFIRRYQASVRSLAAFEKSPYADDWRDLMRLYLVRRTRTFVPSHRCKMRVAVLHVEIHIPYAQSLKDKRMVLRRLKDRLQKFNVAVAEIEHQDLWQRASLGIVAISNTTLHVEQELAAAADEIERLEPGLISRSEVEYLT